MDEMNKLIKYLEVDYNLINYRKFIDEIKLI